MKILVVGGTGMLGHKLVQVLSPKFDVFTTIRGKFEDTAGFGIFERQNTFEHIDVETVEPLLSVIDELRPDVIINAAGIIKQLPSSHDVVTLLKVNSILPHILAQNAEKFGFRLILISTDCVFKGDKGNYSETDVADATDLYGRSKNLGEVMASNVLTIRTSIIGRELSTAHSLVEWFLSNRGRSVDGFARAIYSGFPTVVFADIIANLLVEHADLNGLYHISSDPIDKYELLKLINDRYKAGVSINKSVEFAIDRSLDSGAFRAATAFKPDSWEQMIERMASDATPYDAFRNERTTG